MKQEIERGYHPRATGPIKLYLFKHEALGKITANGRSKYEAVAAAARRLAVRRGRNQRGGRFTTPAGSSAIWGVLTSMEKHQLALAT